MDQLYREIADYCKLVWKKTCSSDKFNESTVEKVVINYGDFIKSLVPADSPYAKYIHIQRIIYDMYMNNELLVFCFDPKDPDLTEIESFYSTNEFEDEDDSSDARSFINGVRMMDEYDFREQINANEFSGGYWEPEIHWVVLRKSIANQLPKKIKRVY
jgi:hypothetical protein